MTRVVLAAFLTLAWLAGALAQTPNAGGMVPNAQPLTDATGNIASRFLGNAQPRLVPVCSGGRTSGDNNLTTAANSTSWRTVYWCPRGASSVSFIITGFYTSSSPAETDLANPIPINIGVESFVSAPWDSATAYLTGAKVTYGFSQWTALSGNTNSPPDASNANWTALAAVTPVPVTCNGNRACRVPTVTTAAGATITQGLIQTDPLPITVPVGGYIAVNGFIAQTTAEQHALGVITHPFRGEFWNQSGSQTDRSLTGAVLVTSTNPTEGPIAAVIGVPLTPGPTACYLADSRGSGAVGRTFGVGTPTIAVGGTGYVAADVGKVVTADNAGAAATAISSSFRAMITSVSAGAVNGVIIVDGGAYNNPAINAGGGALPTGAQTMTGPTTGTGLQITWSTTGGFDPGGQSGGGGFIARGLDANNIPWVGITRSSDTMASWVTRGYSRINLIEASGCSTVIFGLGVNDLASGLPTMQANALIIANQVASRPTVKAVLFATLPPYATSSDGFKTTVNQTPNGAISTLIAFNNWGRARPAPFTGVLEMANPVSSAVDSGLWTAGGAVNCLYSCDGLHMVPAGAIQSGTGITAGIGQFQ